MISFPADALNYYIIYLGKRLNVFMRFNYVDTDNTLRSTVLTTLNAAFPCYQIISSRCQQSDVCSFLCRNGYLEQMNFSAFALWATKSHILGQP